MSLGILGATAVKEMLAERPMKCVVSSADDASGSQELPMMKASQNSLHISGILNKLRKHQKTRQWLLGIELGCASESLRFRTHADDVLRRIIDQLNEPGIEPAICK
jgi:hypothetical protein